MSNLFSSRYFPLIKADKLQREPLICVSTSIYSLKHSNAFTWSRVRNASFATTRNRKHSSKEAVDALTEKLIRMCFIYYLHSVLCLVQKASLPIKEKSIRCLYQVENHLLNKPGRLKSREKSIRCFSIQAERSKEIDQCNFSKTCPLSNQNNLCKSRPECITLLQQETKMITIEFYTQVKNSTVSMFLSDNFKHTSHYTDGICIRG